MGSWGNTDDAANSVFYAPSQYNTAANTVNQTALFGNTSVNAIVTGKAVGQFGVSAAEMANTNGESSKVTHAGWVLREAGTGSITSVAITGGGTLYANTDTFTVTAPAGGTNATGSITTNGSGVITAVTITNPGAGFTSVTNGVAITTGTGSGATLSATAGGRAGRVTYETLVAMGTITGDASDDALLPE